MARRRFSHLALEFLDAPNLDAVVPSLQYIPDLENLSVIWRNHTNVIVS